MGKYSLAYYAAVNLANDMKHIHIHCKGELFAISHSICNEYYEKANENADILAELAIEKNEAIMNSAFASEITNYKPANYKEYNFINAMQTTKNCIEKYLKVLESLRASAELYSVQSLLDDMMRYWEKENNYKIKAYLAYIDE